MIRFTPPDFLGCWSHSKAVTYVEVASRANKILLNGKTPMLTLIFKPEDFYGPKGRNPQYDEWYEWAAYKANKKVSEYEATTRDNTKLSSTVTADYESGTD
jgi:hypothetical protein